MRFYGFGNYYLSSLQQGLQAGHTIAELFIKYDITDLRPISLPAQLELVDKHLFVFDWAKYHKTMVLLNGGNSADLTELFEFLSVEENPYPIAKFNEDLASLNGALTYVGVILPEKIYNAASEMRGSNNYSYAEDSSELHVYDAGSLNFQSFNKTLYKMSAFEFALCKRLNQYGLAK